MLQPSDVGAIEFEGRLILFQERSRALFILNGTARLIWETVRTGANPEEAARLLAETCGVPLTTAQQDVKGILEQWRARGLLNCGQTATPARHVPSSPPRPAFRFASTRVYAPCGRSIRFRFGASDLEELIHPLFAPWEVRADEGADTIDLFRDGADRIVAVNGGEGERCAEAEDTLGSVVHRVLDLSYPEARWLAILHAGAVARDGRAVLLPGGSGSGKSTLTASLVRTGLAYLSDDLAPLDGRTGRVMPAPFAVCLKEGSWPVLSARFPALRRLRVVGSGARRRRYLDLSAAVCSTAAAGLSVGAIVFPRYRPDRLATLRRVPPLEALERLLEAGCWIPITSDHVSALLRVLSETPCYAIEYNGQEKGVALALKASDK